MERYANRLKHHQQLRDRFATGLNHAELQIDLKQKWPDLQDVYEGKTTEVTFAQIFAIAQSRELAEHDDTIPTTSVHKVNYTPTTSAHKANYTSTRVHKDNYEQKGTRSAGRLLQPNQCKRCGKRVKHDIQRCAARNHTCEACNQEGHFESCCIKSGRAYFFFQIHIVILIFNKYNFVIGNDGRVYEGRGWNKEGAHTVGFNRCAVGIGFMGDYREELPVHTKVTPEQLRNAHMLFEEGVKKGHMIPDYHIIAARDVRPTQSPGSNLYKALQQFEHFNNGKQYEHKNCSQIHGYIK
ncbi:hypothetical protein evm_006595 [Chilo suppressalis]|nr:hypothetical protein evm_006595 [Chilo suppressalis]